jgi:hypothetical protein
LWIGDLDALVDRHVVVDERDRDEAVVAPPYPGVVRQEADDLDGPSSGRAVIWGTSTVAYPSFSAVRTRGRGPTCCGSGVLSETADAGVLARPTIMAARRSRM